MLTKQMQVQAVVDLVAGLAVKERTSRRAKDFGEPWKTLWERLSGLEMTERGEALIRHIESLAEADKLMLEIMRTKPGATLGKFPSLADEAEHFRPVEWLWKKWIPLSMLTLLGAQPGTGKSFAALDFCKRIIHGERWPDGQAAPVMGGAPAIYVDAENVPQLIHARAKAMGLNQRKLYLMHPGNNELLLDLSGGPNQEKLANMAAQIEPALIIVDSVSSILPSGENAIEDVRVTLSFLNTIAQEFSTAVVLIHHLRKHSSSQIGFLELSLDDFRGSGHIVAMARSVIGISVVQTSSVEDRGAPRKFEVMKTNLSEYAKPLGYTIQKVDDEGGATMRWNATAPSAYKEPTQRDECREWLEDFLKEAMEGKPVSPKEVVKAASDEGFSRALVFQARKELRAHIKNTEGRKSNKNCWQWSDAVIGAGDDYEDDSGDIAEDGELVQ